MTLENEAKAVVRVELEVEQENILDFLNDWESIGDKLRELARIKSAEMEMPAQMSRIVPLRLY